MKSVQSMSMRARERGQTIIIAMVVLGVLLILGVVFLGIIDKNNRTTYNLGNRSAANDLSEAGIRYAHSQLLTSLLGADWRGTPTSLGTNTNTTLDPDAYWLRPAATLADGTPLTIVPGGTQIDLGGPDGLGAYFRVNYANGRSLVRVRYAPSDANIFSSNPTGPLRNPGLARSYIIIESIGREGLVNTNDPTTLSTGTAVQYQNYTADADFRTAFAQMQAAEAKFPFTQINRAFASIGIIETARYISNKYNVTRAADIGIPAELGAIYNGQQVASNLPYQLGGAAQLYNLGTTPTLSSVPTVLGGSIYANTNVVIHGNVQLDLNRPLGDEFDVAGSVKGDAPNTSLGYAGGQLTIALSDIALNSTVWSPVATNTLVENDTAGNNTASLDSQSPAFSTVRGTFRDGNSSPDSSGFPRGVGYKAPPSMEVIDPDTGENRYVVMTADSGESNNSTTGQQLGAVNDGKYGFGSGVYVYNPSDVQGPVDEVGRQNVGSEQSLMYDMLNPNNGGAHSAWQGYLYVPPGAVFQGKDDGFSILRNSQAPQAERDWRYVDGADAGSSFTRYRIGIGVDGAQHIVNTFTPNSPATPHTPININGALAASDFQKGPVFNGVIYFEGNVRIRGIIPTDVQLTLVSNATIYIEGNITKGVTANGLQTNVAAGSLLTRPSLSMLMLMAKDYVVVNTTQFFAPDPEQGIEPVNDTPNSVGYNPIRIRTAGSSIFDFDFARDPNGPVAQPGNPSTTRPFEFDYTEAGSPSVKIPTGIVMADTMDDGPASATFIQWDFNYGQTTNTNGGAAPSPYFFLSTNNTASTYIAGVSTTNAQPIQEYGLGADLDQRYPKFEQGAGLYEPNAAEFTVIPTTATMTTDGQEMLSNGITGTYALFAEGVNQLLVRQVSVAGAPTNDYLIGRMALAPHDIQIQAAMFAEEGSFFVIPGPWFNPDPNDRRDSYVNGTDVYAGATTTAEKDAIRLENFGAWNTMPFYGEPLDIRIVVTGAVSENMPPPASVQAEYLKKWGWIPSDFAATGLLIPKQHVPTTMTTALTSGMVVPNLMITYDPALATARSGGFTNSNSTTAQNSPIRVDGYGRPLPPMPRLPVSPVLAYFGEVE